MLFGRRAPASLENPAFRLVNHLDNLSQNFVEGIIQFIEGLLTQVVMSKSDLNVDLGLSGFSLPIAELLRQMPPWYRLFLHASARFARTEREDLLI